MFVCWRVFFVYELTQVVSAGGSFARQQNTEGLPSDVTNVPSGKEWKRYGDAYWSRGP